MTAKRAAGFAVELLYRKKIPTISFDSSDVRVTTARGFITFIVLILPTLRPQGRLQTQLIYLINPVFCFVQTGLSVHWKDFSFRISDFWSIMFDISQLMPIFASISIFQPETSEIRNQKSIY